MATKYLYTIVVLAIVVLAPGCPAVKPMANFTLEPDSGVSPLHVTFMNHSRSGMGPRIRYQWDFGDGSPMSTLESPVHLYTTPGTYDVTLTVFTLFGKDTMTRYGAVRVGDDETTVTVDFDAAPPFGYSPLTVSFTDTAIANGAAIQGWHWQFGDGASSTKQHPQHIYQLPGTYTVSLSVDTNIGTFKSVKPNCINVQSPEELLSARRTLYPNAHVGPGAYVYISVIITGTPSSALTALSLQETLPSGWNYVNLVQTGTVPDQVQFDNTSGNVSFGWREIPEFPLQFIYRILAQPDCAGTSSLNGVLRFRYSGPTFTVPTEETLLRCFTVAEGEGESAEGEGGPVEGEGEAEGESEPYVSVFMLRSNAAENYFYTPGQEMEITVRLETLGYGSPTTICVYEQLPDNWRFAGLRGGTLPEQSPASDASGELTFAWPTTTPELPFSFTYAVIPPEASERALFTGITRYDLGGNHFLSNEVQTYFSRYETLIELNRTVAPSAYTPGGTLDMTLHYRRHGTELPLAFGCQETLPEGCSFLGIVDHSGAAPAITPKMNALGVLDFAWIEPPTMPGSFTYRVSIPPSTTGTVYFRGRGLYRFTGAEQQTASSDIHVPRRLP